MKISQSILILQENGELSELYHKWWRVNKIIQLSLLVWNILEKDVV
jgi:hypothetical protein